MRRIVLVAALLGLSGAVCVGPEDEGPGEAPSCANKDLYYYYFDQKITLTLDASQIGLYASGGLSAEAADALGDVGIEASDLRAHAIAGWYLAPVPAEKADACDVEELVAVLAGETAFNFVTPVFSGPQLITQDLLVTFNNDISRDGAQRILDELQAGEITDLSLSIYTVRSPSRNGFEVLEAANRLKEQAPVVFAEPDRIVTGSASIEDKLDGRNYYAFEQGFTCSCAGHCAEATVIPSWVDRLGFMRDEESGRLELFQMGNGCDDWIRTIDYVPGEFQFSEDLNSLTYRGKTYEYREEIPQF